jgi:signal peptidase II
VKIARRLVLILFVLFACVGCDQATKSLARSLLTPTEVWSFLGDTVRLQLSHNRGAFLSLGASLPEVWRQTIFNGGVGALLLGLFIYALFSKGNQPVGVVAIAVFSAGGLSNLIDRLVHGGYVVDFINLGIGPLRTGIFNVADIFIMGGIALFLLTNVTGQEVILKGTTKR